MNRFEKYIPCSQLAPFIKYFVISEQETEQVYKVLPGTSIVWGFQYKGHLTWLASDVENMLSPMGVTGLQEQFRIFKNADYTGTILVYFKEQGASFFLRNPLHELFDQSLSLEHFIDGERLNNFQDQLAEAGNDLQRIHLVEQLLLSQLQPNPPDLFIASALRKIYDAKGILRIKTLAETLGISQSPFEKRFRKIVGASPKKFASIVRIQSMIKAFAVEGNKTDTGYEYGYYDQAHFIKTFKQFTGDTPGEFSPGKEYKNDFLQ